MFLKDQVTQNSLFGTCNTCCIFHQGKQYRIRCLAHVTHVVYFTKESNTKFYSFSKARRKKQDMPVSKYFSCLYTTGCSLQTRMHKHHTIFGPKKPWSAATFTANIKLLSGAIFSIFFFFEKKWVSRSTAFSHGAVPSPSKKDLNFGIGSRRRQSCRMFVQKTFHRAPVFGKFFFPGRRSRLGKICCPYEI